MRLPPAARAFFITILFFVMTSSVTHAKEVTIKDDWDPTFKEAIKKLTKEGSLLDGKNIAVGAFINEYGKISNLSVLVSETFEKNLNTGAYMLLKSSDLELEMSKWHIGTMGRVNVSNVVQAGKLLGVDIFLLGSVRPHKNESVFIDVSLVDSSNGETLSEANISVSSSNDIVSLDNDRTTVELTVSRASSNNEGGINIEVWTDKEEYADGAPIRFFIRADSDCYLTLIHADALGNLTKLFPNFYDRSNKVMAGKEYSIPSESAGFDFIASAPYGYEIIRAIASKRPDVDIEDVSKRAAEEISAENPFASFITLPEGVTKSLTKSAGEAKKGEWAEAVIKIKIKPNK